MNQNIASELIKKKCIPCEAGTAPFTDEEVEKYAAVVPSWEIIPRPKQDIMHKIRKKFKFKDFKEAMVFVNKAAGLAEEEGHHPDIKIVYNRVTIELVTHSIGGLSENDFIMAAKIDQIKI